MIEHKIKNVLRENVLSKGLYQKAKSVRNNRKNKLATEGKHKFIDRRNNADIACFILAGYKSFLYEDVFGRIKKFIPSGIDVCIVSSGLYSEELAKIAEDNDWSYLSVERNCVTLAQNIAILKYPKAEYFYKIDEDIFVTENAFETMMETYKNVEINGDYKVGFVAPLIPINGYGHLRLLKKLNLEKYYIERFEKPIYAANPNAMVEKSDEAAKFFWNKDGVFPKIDDINKMLNKEDFQYTACPVRFSIGFILMKRSTWEEMGMWPVLPEGACMGLDEVELCSYCIVNSKAIIVSENTVVGHLSFGQQNNAMKEYHKKNREIFKQI